MQSAEPDHTLSRRRNRLAQQLFDGLPSRYDRLAEVLSFGQNRRWRRAMVDAVAPWCPATVLDVATGPAGVALQLADRTRARVTGVDLTPEMLLEGAANVARSPQARRINLVLARGEQLPFADATFDALTFTYLLRYVESPTATLEELVRVVKPGGIIANLEFCVPEGRLWHPLWMLYTRVGLPTLGFCLGGREWFDVGRFLGPSISGYYRHYPLAWHITAWQQAGLENIRARTMSLGGGLVMWGRKSPVREGAAREGAARAPWAGQHSRQTGPVSARA
ncbi:MAG TPA: class I SAM-dependent methyltransferase [Acidimicrobiales bacterium]|nr:class I SAM-dependent methyltransferase [Acidimicrobiales bacterium]